MGEGGAQQCAVRPHTSICPSFARNLTHMGGHLVLSGHSWTWARVSARRRERPTAIKGCKKGRRAGSAAHDQPGGTGPQSHTHNAAVAGARRRTSGGAPGDAHAGPRDRERGDAAGAAVAVKRPGQNLQACVGNEWRGGSGGGGRPKIGAVQPEKRPTPTPALLMMLATSRKPHFCIIAGSPRVWNCSSSSRGGVGGQPFSRRPGERRLQRGKHAGSAAHIAVGGGVAAIHLVVAAHAVVAVGTELAGVGVARQRLLVRVGCRPAGG